MLRINLIFVALGLLLLAMDASARISLADDIFAAGGPVILAPNPACKNGRNLGDLKEGDGFCRADCDDKGQVEAYSCYYRVRSDLGYNRHFQRFKREAGDVFNKKIAIFKANNPNAKNGMFDEPPHKLFNRSILTWILGKDFKPFNDRYMSELKFLDVNIDGDLELPAWVEVAIHSYQRGYNKEFGVDVGVHYGKRETDEDPPKFALDGLGNLVQMFVGIGNPLSSFLSLGLNIANDKNQILSVEAISIPIILGEQRMIKTGIKDVITGDINPITIEAMTELHISAIPEVVDDHMFLRVEPFSFVWSVRPPDSETLVKTVNLGGGQTFTVEPDGTKTILARMENKFDMRTGELFGAGKSSDYSNTLISLSIRADLEKLEDPDLEPGEERPPLWPKGKNDILDVFQSVEWQCFKDIVNPKTNDKICGFYFSKLDEKLKDLIVHAWIADSRGRKVKGSFKPMVLSNLFRGDDTDGNFIPLGWFNMPVLDKKLFSKAAQLKEASLSLHVTLDTKRSAFKKLYGKPNAPPEAYGFDLPFTYTPSIKGYQIDYSMDDMKIHKKKKRGRGAGNGKGLRERH